MKRKEVKRKVKRNISKLQYKKKKKKLLSTKMTKKKCKDKKRYKSDNMDKHQIQMIKTKAEERKVRKNI